MIDLHRWPAAAIRFSSRARLAAAFGVGAWRGWHYGDGPTLPIGATDDDTRARMAEV
jgi:hypothetical protein